MWRSPLLMVVTLMLAVNCSPNERRLDFDDFYLLEQPAGLPPLYPEVFQMPDTRLLGVGVHGLERFTSSQESIAVLESMASPEEVSTYYTSLLDRLGWQIIQSQNAPGRQVLMAESRAHRLATIVIQGGGPVQIKLYLKNAALQ